MEKAKVGFYGLTGCAGDLLNILNCEDEVVDIFNAVLVKSFVMASSAKDEKSPLDIAFVEGSVSTKKDLEDLKEIRKKTKILIAIGHCATDGGVQSMYVDKNFLDRLKNVYGSGEAITLTKPLESKPLSAYVKVDYEISGCPISKEQFLRALGRLIIGTVPNLYTTPVCAECKWKENDCLLLKGKPCIGPLTRGGCDAKCPSFNVPCIGCWGPVDDENYEAHFEYLKSKDIDRNEIMRRFSIFGGTERAEKLKKLLEVKK